MFERFTKGARVVVTRAEDEARSAGARTIEAEHLLLAATEPLGLHRSAIEAALIAEWHGSLAAAGVDLVPPPPVRYDGRVRFGASAKASLERSVRIATERGDKRLEPRHVVQGIVSAERGTVPRALRRAGIDLGSA